MNQCLKQFSEMKYRDTKEKSNVSTKFSKELQFSISISRFRGFDELVKDKLHYRLFIIGLASHLDSGRFARIRAFIYVVIKLLIVEFHCLVAFVLISANVV